jgi:hypothetical protein
VHETIKYNTKCVSENNIINMYEKKLAFVRKITYCPIDNREEMEYLLHLYDLRFSQW